MLHDVKNVIGKSYWQLQLAASTIVQQKLEYF